MNINELINYGIKPEIIDVWKSEGIETLMPMQSKAVIKYNLFGQEKNLLVVAPTSSGKTFVGEMAAARAIQNQKKVIYVTPLKVIAEEKYNDFKRKYSSLGTRVAISTRDHKEFDGIIESYDFDIAFIVIEKMYQLLVKHLNILEHIGLIIVDEFHTIVDKDRGITLELLLSKCLLGQMRLPGKYKIIGLSAVMGENSHLKKWLNADILHHEQRPVELRRGILRAGVFEYQTHNGCENGKEELINVPGGDERDTIKANAIEFVKRNETVLVFLCDKTGTREMAERLSEMLSEIPYAAGAIEELRNCERTTCLDSLIRCLEHGVAFHNADMSFEERGVVEKFVISGEIRVVISTGTLGMGVNLPIKNVLVESEVWRTNSKPKLRYCNGTFEIPKLRKLNIGISDFENKGGRAGRKNMESDFGRAILVLRNNCGLPPSLNELTATPVSHYRDAYLGTVILNLVASGCCGTGKGVANFLRWTLSGRLMEQDKINEEVYLEEIREEFRWCVNYGFLEKNNEKMSATEAGKICADNGINIQTAKIILDWLKAVKCRDFSELELLYILMKTFDAQKYYYPMSDKEDRSHKYHDLMKLRFPIEARDYFSPYFHGRRPLYEGHKMMKGAIVLHDWISGVATQEIEKDYALYLGTIQNMAEGMRWLIDAVTAFAMLLDFPESKMEFFKTIRERLKFGTTDAGLSIARLCMKGITRDHLNQFVKTGLDSIEKIKDASADQIFDVLPLDVAQNLFEKLGFDRSPDTCEEHPACTRKGDGECCESGKNGNSEVFIHFDGTPSGKRTQASINGTEVFIPTAIFEDIFILCAALHLDGDGWVLRDRLYPSGGYQGIARIRKYFKECGIKADNFILNNGEGAYTIRIPKRNLSFDFDKLKKHWSVNVRELANKLEQEFEFVG